MCLQSAILYLGCTFFRSLGTCFFCNILKISDMENVTVLSLQKYQQARYRRDVPKYTRTFLRRDINFYGIFHVSQHTRASSMPRKTTPKSVGCHGMSKSRKCFFCSDARCVVGTYGQEISRVLNCSYLEPYILFYIYFCLILFGICWK